MEQIYKISACGRTEKPHHASQRPLRLAILTVCLLMLLSQVSARPSDVTKPVEATPTTTIADRTSSSSNSPASTVLSHNQKRRSVEEQPEEDYDDEVDYERVKRCHEDEDVNELCQRCSKVTKSSIVFPMCCSNEDETMDWCKAYVYYGIQN